MKKKIITGTGFFIKLKLKNKIKHFLITCHHVIEKNFVKEKKVITFYYGKVNKEKKLEIKLDKNKRYIRCFDKPIDITLIEILEKDNIIDDKFLQPDMNYKSGYDFYKNKFFYLAGYPKNNERSVSSGQITNILAEPEFEHSLDTLVGNSGSPICFTNNLLVVGIHKQGSLIGR